MIRPAEGGRLDQDWLVAAALDSGVEEEAAAGAADGLGVLSVLVSGAFVSDVADSAAGALLLAA